MRNLLKRLFGTVPEQESFLVLYERLSDGMGGEGFMTAEEVAGMERSGNYVIRSKSPAFRVSVERQEASDVG